MAKSNSNRKQKQAPAQSQPDKPAAAESKTSAGGKSASKPKKPVVDAAAVGKPPQPQKQAGIGSLLLKLAPLVALAAVVAVLVFLKPSPGGTSSASTSTRKHSSHVGDSSKFGLSAERLSSVLGEGIYEAPVWPHLEVRFALKPMVDEDDADADGQKCVDQDASCPNWAAADECQKNPSYMLRNCRFSCQQCERASKHLTRMGEPNTIPQLDGHAELCARRSEIRPLHQELRPVTEALTNPRSEAVFVMRNGRNEGVWLSWPAVKQETPDDLFLGPMYGCLHHLVQTAGKLLAVPERILKNLEVQVTTDSGILVPTGDDVRPGMHLHLVLPHELWQWPGIEIGHRQLLQDWSSAPGVRDHAPLVMETLSLKPKIFHLEGILSEEEADEVVRVGLDGLRRSGLGLDGGKTNDQRTSTSSSIPGARISKDFRWRAFDLVRINYREPMQDGFQLVRYLKGQFFRQHTDTFGNSPAKPRTDEDPERWADRRYKQLIDRYATLFLYLNDVPEGGETVFPKAVPPSSELQARDGDHFGMAECAKGLAVRPRKAQGVLFYDMLPEQELDALSLHGGCPPPQDQEKFGANFWIWNNDRFVKQRAGENKYA